MIRAAGLLLLLLSVLSAVSAVAADARAAVETFLARLGRVDLTDLSVVQTVTLFHPDGRHAQATGEQRLYLKLPGRQRFEQTLEGRREVRLVVGDRVWVLRPDGRVSEAGRAEARRLGAQLVAPFRRSAADLLAEWRAHGVRDDLAREERIGERTVTVIGAGAGDRGSPAVWLDPERGVVRFVAREQVGERSGLVDQTFSDHRPLVGGFHYPYRQELFFDGRLLYRVVVREVAVNSNIAPDLFDPDALRRGR